MSLEKGARIELEVILKKWETQGVGSAYVDLKQFLERHPYAPREDEEHCAVQGCPHEIKYEAWMRHRDPFTQKANGHISLVAICEEHKTHPWLCANETKEEAYGTSNKQTTDAAG